MTSPPDPLVERRLRALNGRLRARGLEAAAVPDPASAVDPSPDERSRARLSVFSPGDIEACRQRLGPIFPGRWPSVEGCLGVVFASRSGSTFLARELAKRRRIGQMEECFHPNQVAGVAAADMVRSHADGWFSYKLAANGVIGAELCGAMSHYIDATVFILLRRRDIVAQAVSEAKAIQTGQWHSINPVKGVARYDADRIGQEVRNIARAVATLRQYLRLADRPWRSLYYEDFEHGDFSTAEAICEDFGIPPQHDGGGPRLRPLERTADAVNAEWIARYGEDMDRETRAMVDQYVADL